MERTKGISRKALECAGALLLLGTASCGGGGGSGGASGPSLQWGSSRWGSSKWSQSFSKTDEGGLAPSPSLESGRVVR